MIDLNPDNPARFLPFADPAHDPDWLSRNDPARPAWLSRDEETFTAYCLTQLGELDRRACTLNRESAAVLDLLWRNRDAEMERCLPLFLDMIGWSREQFERAKRRKLEEWEVEATRAGPTKAGPDRQRLPSALAAQDIAKLRFVIFPRFWDRQNRKRPSAEEIAARRHGCTPAEAESWYENNRVKHRWNKHQV